MHAQGECQLLRFSWGFQLSVRHLVSVGPGAAGLTKATVGRLEIPRQQGVSFLARTGHPHCDLSLTPLKLLCSYNLQ